MWQRGAGGTVAAFRRAKGLAHLFRVESLAGDILALTDHDRPLTFEGLTYRPVLGGTISADRRDAGLRETNSELHALVRDGVLPLDQLESGTWRGAEVQVRIVHWREPWLVEAAERRWIQTLEWNEGKLVATLSSRATELQRQVAGDFGGVYAPTCNYRLGDPRTCKVDIGALTQLGAVTTGTSTGGGDWSDLRDTGAAWTTDQFVDYWVRITGGTGSGQMRRVLTNTATILYVHEVWTTRPDNTSTYEIGRGVDVASIVEDRLKVRFNTTNWPTQYVDDFFRDGNLIWTSGANAGKVAEIITSLHANREVHLFFPSAMPIAIGDTAIVQPGCDGLLSTCIGKFNNVLNFGGSPYDPGSGFVLDPPKND